MGGQPNLRAFQENLGITEILGLGGIRENPHGSTEAQIEVCWRSAFSQTAKLQNVGRTWIGIGQLNLLSTGNKFRQGILLSAGSSKRYRGKLTFQHRIKRETLGAGSFSPTDEALTREVAGAPGWLLRFEESARPFEKAISRPRFAFLPTIELLRALFGSSSEMLKQLVDGRRDPITARSRFSIDRNRSVCSDDGSVIIHADRALAREDVLVIAMLYADQSGRMLRFHDSIHQKLNTDPMHRTTRGAFLEVDWPWRRPIEMEFTGGWFYRMNDEQEGSRSSRPKARFVVKRIEKIFFSDVPTSIEVRYPEKICTDLDMPPPDGRRVMAHKSEQALRSDRVPNVGRMPTVIETSGTEFDFAEEMRISWSPGHVYAGRTDKGMRPDPVNGEHFLATDDPRAGGDGATGPASVRRSHSSAEVDREGREIEHARRKTWSALMNLAYQKGWNVSFWGEGGGTSHVVEFNPTDLNVRAPKVAIIVTASGIKAVADLGSSSDAPVSLGVVSQTGNMSVGHLANRTFQEARLNGVSAVFSPRRPRA